MRAVNEGHIVITCDKGVNQATHPYLSPVGTFDVVQNMRIRGAGVLEKRPGSRAIGNATLDDVAPPLVASGSTDLPSFIATSRGVGLLGSSSGYVYAHNSTGDAVVPSGHFPTCQPKKRRSVVMGADSGTTASMGTRPTSVAVNSAGYVMTATTNEADDIFVTIDSPEGTRIFVRSDSLGNYDRVKCVAQGAKFILFYLLSTGSVCAQDYEPTAAGVTAGTEQTLASAMVGSYIDAVPFSATHWFAMWHLGSGNFVVAKVATATVSSSITITQSNAAAVPVSLFVNSTNVWASWIRDTPSAEIMFAVYLATNLTTVLAPTAFSGGQTSNVAPLLMGPGSTDARAFYVLRDASVALALTGTVLTNGSVEFGGSFAGVIPISKPDDEGRFWSVLLNETLISETVRVALLGNTLSLAISVELALDEMPFVSLAVSGLSNYGFFSNQAAAASSRFFAAPFVLTTIGSEQLSRIDLLEYTALSDERHRATSETPAALVCAGQPTELCLVPVGLAAGTTDALGRQGSCPIGFPAPPAISLAFAAGSALTAGSYTYQAVYEWADGLGRRHQSPPSDPKTITLATAGQVQITHTLCGITRRSQYWTLSTAYLVLYRTVNGGTELHRLPLNTLASSGTVSDATTDATIADEEFIYTAGNVLPNVLAPSCRFVRLAAGRLWLGGLWNADQIECSKLIVPDEQTAFTGDASHRVSVGADVTGLASIDDQLVIFTEDAIFTVTGEGPNDQGIGSFVSRSVSLGVGCIDERSIAETDLGVLFRSRLGWHLLPRGLGPPQYIGAGIQDTAQDFPTTLGAAVWHGNDSHLARFLVQNEAGDATRVLSFELTTGQWFIDTHAREMAEIGVWPSGFVLAEASFDTAVTSNPLWIEDPDEVADAVRSGFTGEHIEQRLRTNWITPAGPGNQAALKQAVFQLISETAAAVTTRIEADTDESAQTHSNAWSLSASSYVTYRYIVTPKPSGTSFRVTIFDGEVSSEPTRGVKLLAVTLESNVDGGVRLPLTGEKA